MRIFSKLTELIGNTPLLELTEYNRQFELSGRLFAKLEYFNPLGSVKDRIAYAMVAAAEKNGELSKDMVLIEPTSGNTGIGLAFIAASKGYKLILTMPETMSIERRAAVFAAAQIATRPEYKGKIIVVIFPDTGERYLSTELYRET